MQAVSGSVVNFCKECSISGAVSFAVRGCSGEQIRAGVLRNIAGQWASCGMTVGSY